MLDHEGQISFSATVARGSVYVRTVVSYSLAYDATDVMDNDNVATVLSAQIQISIAPIGMVRKPLVEATALAERWDITSEKTHKILQATMQTGIKTILNALLLRQFRINDRNLHYCHLAHLVFSDMIFANTVSRRGNKCAQVYATNFGWARAFPMTSRSEAHETLSLLFVTDGVPPACICDSVKEMIQGKLYQKLKDAACHLKQLESYIP